jgi:hypothetical protein
MQSRSSQFRPEVAFSRLGPWTFAVSALRFAALLTVCLCLLQGGGIASAQAQPTVPEPVADPLDAYSFSLGLTGAKIGEDWFVRTTLGSSLRFEGLTLARQGNLFDEDQSHDLRLLVQVPLTFRIVDRDPETGEVLRTEEWDEAAEYMRVLRVIEYGRPYDGIYFRGGELANVRMGHRTIVDNYLNTLDVDHLQWGLHHNLNTIYGGYEVLLDNVPAPELMGTRVYVRPWSFVDRNAWMRRLAVGMSLFGDIAAPTALAIREDGRYAQNSDGNFIIEGDQATGILGFDVELAAVESDLFSMTPYTDANVHLGRGAGWHLGSFFALQPLDALVVDARSEFRVLGQNYLPTYFNTLYEVERVSYRAPGESPTRIPKLQWLRTGQEARVREGYLTEIGLNFGQVLRVAGAWENYRGPDNSTAWLYVSVPALRVVQFAAYYANTRFQGARGLFDMQNALAMVEARVMVTKFMYVQGQLNRRWRLDGDGDYRPVDDFHFGVGASFGF